MWRMSVLNVMTLTVFTIAVNTVECASMQKSYRSVLPPPMYGQSASMFQSKRFGHDTYRGYGTPSNSVMNDQITPVPGTPRRTSPMPAYRGEMIHSVQSKPSRSKSMFSSRRLQRSPNPMRRFEVTRSRSTGASLAKPLYGTVRRQVPVRNHARAQGQKMENEQSQKSEITPFHDHDQGGQQTERSKSPEFVISNRTEHENLLMRRTGIRARYSDSKEMITPKQKAKEMDSSDFAFYY